MQEGLQPVRTFLPIVLCLLAGALLSARGQRPNLTPGMEGERPVPTVTFEWAAGASPAHYAIALDSEGRAAYRSDQLGTSGASETGNGTPYLFKFTISAATTARVFKLARQANYFAGDLALPQPRPGRPNIKILRYGEGPDVFLGNPTRGQRNTLTYEVPKSPAVQELTNLFEQISATLELGHRVDRLRQTDRAALAGELQRAEALARAGRLAELGAIAPPLESVARDPSVSAEARRSARQLLAMAGSP